MKRPFQGNPYTELGLVGPATLARIKAIYRAICLEIHPDVNKSTNAHEKFVRMQAAYEALQDPFFKADLDARLHSGPQQPVAPRWGTASSRGLSEDQYDEIVEIVAAWRNDGYESTSEWEDEFMSSMSERIAKYGRRTFVSEKQWSVLRRIGEKLGI